jgi:hypothetical protein
MRKLVATGSEEKKKKKRKGRVADRAPATSRNVERRASEASHWLAERLVTARLREAISHDR